MYGFCPTSRTIELANGVNDMEMLPVDTEYVELKAHVVR